jgi:hypothetical protein
VRIVAVLRGAVHPGANIDTDNYFVTDNDALARLGGVTKNDRIHVEHIQPDGRVTYIPGNPRAVDLALLSNLDKATKRSGR